MSLHEANWHEARQLSHRLAPPTGARQVLLAAALGEHLAVDVTAHQAIPHYASSAMDGWAVAGSPPWHIRALPERGDESRHRWAPPLASGEALPTVTGGLIPDGADAVLRMEHGALSPDGVLTISPDAPADRVPAGAHIRPAGDEAERDEVIIPAGTPLNPAHIALAAVAGHDSLAIRTRPEVAVLLTGDEVVEHGLPLPGQVRDAFGVQLPGFVAMLGGRVRNMSRVPDSADATRVALERALAGGCAEFGVGSGPAGAGSGSGPAGAGSEPGSACAGAGSGPAGAAPQIVLTTGGTGKSDVDHLRGALRALGAEFLVDGLAQRPGHPTFLARLDAPGAGGASPAEASVFVVGLPGNPLAAMIAMLTVVQPLIAGFLGAPLPPTVTMPAGRDVAGGKVTVLMPAAITAGRVAPERRIGSNMLRGLAAADVVMVVPAGAGVRCGDPVEALPLPWR